MIKNIFLDRDGIITQVVMRVSTIGSARNMNEFSIRADFQHFYEQIKNEKFNLFVVSNQPDIARNLMNQETLINMTSVLQKKFSFTEIFYCTHDNDDNCFCRKPKPGMILHLLQKHNLKQQESVIIGDSLKDIEAGQNAGIKTILLQTFYNKNIFCMKSLKSGL